MIRSIVGVAMAATLATVAFASAARQEDGSDAARGAVESWLTAVDAGRYPESWEQAGAQFRAAVTADDWRMALEATRSPLGALVSREVDSTTAASTLPGAPDGEYFVFQFRTSFERKESAQETVAAVREPDDAWRVVGYFIR